MMLPQNNMENQSGPGPGFDYVLEGENLFSQGRLDEAEEMFRAATVECPGNAQAWNNLAVIAMSTGREREAEAHLRQAIEIRSDFLEAHLNLVELYCFREDWKKAARELGKILEFNPGDVLVVKRLAQVYLNMGETDKARRVMDESGSIGAMKSFIDSLWLGIKYYAMADELSSRDKLEKFTAAILKFLDGQDGRSRRYKLVSEDPEEGEVAIEGFFENFYYKETPTIQVDDGRGPGESELVLTIGEHDDWDFFREALREEMKAEGGCLGDFTQTRKVLRRERRLAKYSLPATLRYFQDNVGPCDCHVLRAVLV